MNQRLEGKGDRLPDLPVIVERKPDLPEREGPGRERRHAECIAEGLIGEKLAQGLRQIAGRGYIDPEETKHTVSPSEPA
ncbi:MAG: hypothetical protein ACD_87C00099G0001 [uncultured bacterium]|nr:MAG: hypothetical protein ACD_87C00099G0001 [uncultured bacterium]